MGFNTSGGTFNTFDLFFFHADMRSNVLTPPCCLPGQPHNSDPVRCHLCPGCNINPIRRDC